MSKSSGKVKAGQLWSKNKDELTKQLGELKTELSQLRIQKIVSSGTKLTKMYVDSNPSAPRSTCERGRGFGRGIRTEFG
jgi:ribosomal protein L29